MTGARDVWAVVAHDAGGAEVLSSYVRRQRLDCRFALAGPARAVFERKLSGCVNGSIDAALQDASKLLCSTSWQSDFELTAIARARACDLPSVAWLDHWTNYRERFIRNGVICLPDEVWVGDTHAQALALDRLPELPVRLRDNPYVADIQIELGHQTPLYALLPGMLSILYVCEPVREPALRLHGDERYFGYTEEQALRYFLDHLSALGRPVGRIVIRPHPAEEPGKYRGIVAEYPLPIRFSERQTLAAEVASADCVAGCSSMAMVVALIAGKRVISCIPPGGSPCALPQPEIEHLRQIAADSPHRIGSHG